MLASFCGCCGSGVEECRESTTEQKVSFWKEELLRSASLEEIGDNTRVIPSAINMDKKGSLIWTFYRKITSKLIPQRDGPAAGTVEMQVSRDIDYRQIDVKKDSVGMLKNTAADEPGRLQQDQMLMLMGQYKFIPAFASRYRLKQLLGEGSYGTVWVGEERRSGTEVAVKFIIRKKIPPTNWAFETDASGHLSPPPNQMIPFEVLFLRRTLGHPNIIRYLDHFDDGERYVYLVTELFGVSWTWPNLKLNALRNPGLRPPKQLVKLMERDQTSLQRVGKVLAHKNVFKRQPYDLFECLEAHICLSERLVGFIFIQILDTVLYLRSLGIVHRDLKDENIVIDEEYRVKLVDFGSAGYIPGGLDAGEGFFKVFSGTLAFAAPEIAQGRWYRALAAEVWTLGILLYTLVYRRTPFASKEAVLFEEPEYEESNVNGELIDLISKMLVKNPSQRITLDQLSEHPWVIQARQSVSSQVS